MKKEIDLRKFDGKAESVTYVGTWVETTRQYLRGIN